jgi:hypothetical protein
VNDTPLHPELRPAKPPTLFTINGVGLTIYGNRDHDPRDGSYVTTHFLTLVFLPVLALSAYRVVDAGAGNYYFLGKTPLSGRCKALNALVLGLVLLVGSALAFAPSSLEQRLKRGREHVAAKRWPQAVQTLAKLVGTEESEQATEDLKALLSGPLRQAPSADAAEALQALALVNAARPLFDKAQADAWVSVAIERATTDSAGALRLLAALEPLAKVEVAAAREGVLKQILSADPNHLPAACELALLYEEREEAEKCLATLTPFRDRLSQGEGAKSEGARILGNLLLGQGDAVGAEALWAPYVASHLPEVQVASAALARTYDEVEQAALTFLNTQKAPKSWYAVYKAAGSEEAKNKLVREFIVARVKASPRIKAAVEASTRVNRVVQVALELGILRLTAAQSLQGAERKAKLTEIEELFLKIQATAGESQAFKLNLAKVRYWLGRPEEGHKLLDEVLESTQRDGRSLLNVAITLRTVGSDSEARALLEEAYGKAKEALFKQQAARYRALLSLNLADEIEWLEKSSTTDASVMASLAMAKGRRALDQSKLKVSETFLKDAVRRYDQLPVNATTLNNSALALRMLWEATEEQRYFNQSIQRMRKAEARQPSDTVLMFNMASSLIDQAALDLCTPRKLAVARAKGRPGVGLLRYLAYTQEDYTRLRQEFLARPAVAGARSRLEKLLLLSPRARRPVLALNTLMGLEDKEAPFKKLSGHLESNPLDLGGYQASLERGYRGDPPLTEEQWTAGVKRSDRAVKACRNNSTPRTTALAIAMRTATGMAGASWGYPVNLDELVALTDEAFELAPSLATHTLRHETWALRALRRLAGKNPAVAATAKATRRSVSPRYALSALMRREGVRDAVRADPDVRRIGASLVALRKLFPKHGRAWWVPFLRAADAAATQVLLEHLNSDPVVAASHTLERRLHPLSSEVILESAWLHTLHGQSGEAQKLLDAARRANVPLP